MDYVTLTPDLFSTLAAADVWWPTRRDWRQWGNCAIAGEWYVGDNSCRLQLVAVPRHLGMHPEQLGFGPGWRTWGLDDDPRWVVFARSLTPDDGLRLYPGVPQVVRPVWKRYRYLGLPA
jgi:hypothetical protein